MPLEQRVCEVWCESDAQQRRLLLPQLVIPLSLYLLCAHLFWIQYRQELCKLWLSLPNFDLTRKRRRVFMLDNLFITHPVFWQCAFETHLARQVCAIYSHRTHHEKWSTVVWKRVLCAVSILLVRFCGH